MQVLIFKEAGNLISVLTPATKSDIQSSLNQHNSKEQWVAKVQQSASASKNREHHDRRLLWVQSVGNFKALTDEEYLNFIHCDIPAGHKYKFWIDSSKLPANDIFRNAWTDITENGTVIYDPIKAKELLTDWLENSMVSLNDDLQKAQVVGKDSTSIQTASDKVKALLNKTNSSVIESTNDVETILKPIAQEFLNG